MGGYKKVQWHPYGGSANMNFGKISYELIIRDETGNKIDTIRWNNDEDYKRCLEILRLRYGLEYRKKEKLKEITTHI